MEVLVRYRVLRELGSICRALIAREGHLMRCLRSRRTRTGPGARGHRYSIFWPGPLGWNYLVRVVKTWGGIPWHAIEHALELIGILGVWRGMEKGG